mmetsp:Transcript_9067/g.23871  ORF Transcript_9067/g.23871 Transcript_9067/m.23871 type:complete len:82 (+) Transcript_9067:1273-1518(+)
MSELVRGGSIAAIHPAVAIFGAMTPCIRGLQAISILFGAEHDRQRAQSRSSFDTACGISAAKVKEKTFTGSLRVERRFADA